MDNKIKIAYIELDTHLEILLSFYELLKDSEKIDVHFFVSDKIAKKLPKIENLTICNKNNIFEILEKKSFDKIIIGTLHRYFNVFEKIINRWETDVIVHNLNFSKATKFQLLTSVFSKDFKYRIKLILKEKLLKSSLIYKKAKKLWVLSQTLETEKHQYLPLFFNQYSTQKINSENLKIAIIGEVSQKRRDYFHIFQVIKNLSFPIEFLFCGRAKDKELQELKKIKNQKIYYSEDKISQKKFDELVKSSHFIWSPIQRETFFMGVKEFYGKTKFSGNIADGIKYGKRVIVPKELIEKDSPYQDFLIEEKENFELQIKNLPLNFSMKNFSKINILQKLEHIIENSIKF